jgi:hypothetical protein
VSKKLSKPFVLNVNIKAILPFIITTLLCILALSFIPGILEPDRYLGWDIPLHFAAFSEFREPFYKNNFLSFYYYSDSWFGGSTIFKYYQSLVFIILNFLTLLTSINPNILFRVFEILAFILPAFSLQFLSFALLKICNYSKKECSWLSILPALIWLLFPRSMAWTSFGLAGITTGMINSGFGIGFFNIAIAFLLLFVFQKQSRIFFYSACLFTSLTALTHMIASLALAIVIFVLLITNYRRFTLNNIITSLVLICASCAWWYIGFSTGSWIINSRVMPGLASNLFILPLNYYEIFKLNFWGVHWIQIFFFVLIFFGFIQSQTYRIRVISWIAFFGHVFLVSDFISPYLENGLHFYRFFPFFYSLLIAISPLGLNVVYRKWLHPYRFICLTFLCVLVSDSFIGQKWNLQSDEEFNEPLYKYKRVISYGDNTEEKTISDSIVTSIKQNYDLYPGRVFFEATSSLERPIIGSVHAIPAKLSSLKIPSLMGLYSESAPSGSLIQSLVCNISEQFCWSPNNSLLRNSNFFFGTPPLWVSHLQMFGVSIVVAESFQLRALLRTTDQAELIMKHLNRWEIWQIKGARKIVDNANYKPAYFISLEGEKLFKQFSLSHFLQPTLAQFPIIYQPNMTLNEKLRDVCNLKDKISLVILAGGSDVERKDTSIILNQCQIDIGLIKTFNYKERESTVLLFNYISGNLIKWKVADDHSLNAQSQDELIEISTPHPRSIIIRKGYDSDWQSEQGTIYVTSPHMQMFYFGNAGNSKLTFKGNSKSYFMFVLIGIFTIIFLIIKVVISTLKLN